MDAQRGSKKVAVVGGGISGLTAAYRLMQRGHAVTLLEAGERAGGILGTRFEDGYVIETGPDSILSEKPWALALARELGLADEIIGTRTNPRGAYVVHRGRLERVPEGFSMMAPTDLGEILRTPLFSPLGKLRMALELFVPRGAAGQADESLESFVVRRLGRETFERLAQPMVGGIYGADPARLSLRATMPRFLDLEAAHRSVIRGLYTRRRTTPDPASDRASGARYGLFAAFRGGMQTLVDRLVERLGDAVETRSPVTALARGETGFTLEVRGEVRGATRDFDAVVLALPAHVAGRLLAPLDRELASALEAIPYGSAATVTFAYRRDQIAHPMDAFGFVVPASERRKVLAATWSSVKWEGRAPADRALIRVFLGGYQGQDLPERPDAELTALAQRELEALMGVKGEPERIWVQRYLRAMPQYHVGHVDRVAQLEARVRQLPGLALAGNAYRGVGIPDAVKSGEDAAQAIVPPSRPSGL